VKFIPRRVFYGIDPLHFDHREFFQVAGSTNPAENTT
jgi:hypothetical protein